MGQVDVTTSSRLVDPDAAEKMLEENVYERQRPLDSDHVMYLADQMKKGEFTHNDIVLAKIYQGTGKGVILNGQHTLWAIVESGKSYKLPVVTYWVEDEEDYDKIYATLDIQKPRTFRDTARALGVEKHYKLELSESTRLGAAVNFIKDGFIPVKRRIDKVALVHDMEAWVPTFKEFTEMASGDLKQRVLRRGVLSVALLILKNVAATHRQKALDFWTQSIKDDGLPQYDARKVLNKWLYMTAASDGRTQTSADRDARMVAYCWNKYFASEEVRRQPTIDEKQPIRLSGVKI